MPFQKDDLIESECFAFVRGTGRQREELWPGVVFNKLDEVPREYPSRPRKDPADGHVIFYYLPDFEYEVVRVDRLYHEKEVSYIKALASVRTEHLKKNLAKGLAMRMELGGRSGRTREEIASVEAIYPPPETRAKKTSKRKGADEAAGSSKARRVVGSSSRRPSRDDSSDDSDTDMSDSDMEGASHAVDLSDSEDDEEEDDENDSDYEEEEEMRGPQGKGKGKQTRTTRANTPFSLDGPGQGAADIPHDTFDDVNLGDDLTEATGLERIGSVSGASGSLQTAATPAVHPSLASDPLAMARASSKPTVTPPTTTAPRNQASSGGAASSSGKKTQAPFSVFSTGVAKGAPGIHAPTSHMAPLHSGGSQPQPPLTPRHRLLLPSVAPTPVGGVSKIADQSRPAAPSSDPHARAGATSSINGAAGGENSTTPQRGAGPRAAGLPIADIGTSTSAAMITPGAASPLPASKEPSLSDSATTSAVTAAAREGAGGGHTRPSGGSGTEREQSKDSKAIAAPHAAQMPRGPSVEEVCQRLWEEAVARAAVAENDSSYRKYTTVVNLLDTPPSRVQRVITALCRPHSTFDVDNAVWRRNAVELIYDLQAQQGGV